MQFVLCKPRLLYDLQLRTLQMVLRVAALCNTPSQKTAVETAAAQYSCVLSDIENPCHQWDSGRICLGHLDDLVWVLIGYQPA